MSRFWRWVNRRIQAADKDEALMAERVHRDREDIASLPGDTIVVKVIDNGYIIVANGDPYRNEGHIRAVRYAASVEAIGEEIARIRVTERLTTNTFSSTSNKVRTNV
jgi:hypothetical protein